MMKKYTFSIPQPCSAPWDEMTPVEQGRFCAQCEKKVVDFSGMTDSEVIAYYERHGKVCGRFLHTQLDRELSMPAKRKWIPAAMLAGALSLLVPEKAGAQQVKISGCITDAHGTPLPYVNMYLVGTTMGTVADQDGHFSLVMPKNCTAPVNLRFQFIGYETKELTLDSNMVKNPLFVQLQDDNRTMTGDVVIVARPAPRWKFWKRLKRRHH